MISAKLRYNNLFLYEIRRVLHLALFFLLVVCTAVGKEHERSLDFERIGIEHGLSQNTVYSILQDHKGFLWIATNDGLNRYDGSVFKIYASKIGEEGFISNSRTIALLEDSKNRLWIGTIGGGLNRYFWETDSFIHYKYSSTSPNSISNDRVMCLVEDVSGKIWAGTADGGLNLFDPETELFKTYINTIDQPNLLPSNVIRTLYIDVDGTLWVGTDNGVAVFCRDTETFTPIHFVIPKTNVKTKVIRKFFEDGRGNLWIGTDDEGLIRYDLTTKEYSFFLHDPQNPISIPNNTIHDIFQDEDGALWLATFGGLSRLDINENTFSSIKENAYNPFSLSSNQLRVLYEDSFGVFWVGTLNHGLSKTSLKKKRFHVLSNYPGNAFDFGTSTIVSSIHQDKNGNLWFGSSNQGVVKYDKRLNSYEYFKSDFNGSTSLPDNHVSGIAEDSKGNIWVSTHGGVAKYDAKNQQFKHYQCIADDLEVLPNSRVRYVYVDKNDDVWTANLHLGISKFLPDKKIFKTYGHESGEQKAITQRRLTTIFEDSKNNFWIGSSNQGLLLFDRHKERVVQVYKENENDSTSIISSRILTLFEDSKGRLWVGTADGLSLFDYETAAFTNFTTLNGLPNDVICAIEEDRNGRLWISTNKGLSCFTFNDVNNYSFKNYDQRHGFLNNSFSFGASGVLNNNCLAFGGLNSVVSFNPDDIKDNEIEPITHIREMHVFHKNNQVDSEAIKRIILYDDEDLTFSYGENNILFHVTVLHYTSPENNGIKYMLDGFDDSWIHTNGSYLAAKYTNLKPGTYTFKVLSHNSEGKWCSNDSGDSVTFTISSPFWYTWTFYLLLILLLILFLYVFISFRESRLVKRAEELEKLIILRTQELSSKSETLRLQTESLHKANEEINAKSKVLEKQNKALVESNKEITLQRNELEEQKNSLANLAWSLQDMNEEVTLQRNEIERQKSEITDSIMYANRIQQAILPSTESITRLFPEHFILNKPKSIVSGDFYWTTRVGKYRIFAVVDCTGHGVPGGFMSMLGVLLLNEIVNVKKVIDPAEILNRMRDGIISLLHQTGDSDEASDGMDLSLCVINDDTKELTYSGANSVMFIYKVSNPPVDALIEIRSDRMPVGHYLIMNSFTNYTIQLEDGDSLYLYTDGIIDQFGGPHGKKFQPNNLRLFILENHKESMAVQGEKLKEIFNQWKGEYFQVDDVLVMGVRI